MLKKIPAVVAVVLAAGLWMLSGGALMASAQDSTAGSDSGAVAMFPDDEAIPVGSTFVPDGTTSAGTTITDGAILLTAGASLSDGTVVAAGTVLMPDGSLVIFSDAAAWPAGDVVPADFVFAPADLPFTGGSQGFIALFGATLIVLGAGVFAVRERLTLS